MNYLKQFIVRQGSKVKLSAIDPDFKDDSISHADAEETLQQYKDTLEKLQELLYVERRRSLLVCLQGMDGGGKDGVIRHLLSAMNPQGCRVVPFKQPSAEEAAHDFLWRAHRAAPAQGEVVVFNRSHYEDVLIVRVHNLVPRQVWSRRYEQINAFEHILSEQGTHVLKFFLHISNAKQLSRFKARLDDPSKHWKISEADYTEREYWRAYMNAYEEALSRCSTERAPWFVIPANHKWFRDLAIARVVVEYLQGLNLKLPAPTVDLAKIRAEYHAARRDKVRKHR